MGGEENGLRQKRVEIGLNDIVMVSTLSDAKTSIFPFPGQRLMQQPGQFFSSVKLVVIFFAFLDDNACSL